jgi:hypothetical protein
MPERQLALIGSHSKRAGAASRSRSWQQQRRSGLGAQGGLARLLRSNVAQGQQASSA